eukprot:m.314236 g.314236  ORF g.314236 m.314236 type:complete len:1719 (-) comp16409_c0_seq16:107-5263(-)
MRSLRLVLLCALLIGRGHSCLTVQDMVVWVFSTPRVFVYGQISTQNTSAAWIPRRCTAEAAALFPGRSQIHNSSLGFTINAVWLPFFCSVPCLNGSSFDLPQSADIRYLDFTAAVLQDPTLPVDTFASVPNIEWIEGHGVGLPDLSDGLLGGLSNLVFVGSSNNLITTLRNGTFVNNTALRYLSLSDNQITLIEANALARTQVASISLNGNQLTRVPAAGLQGASHTLIQIELSANFISEILSSDFDGLSLVRGLLMARNPVLRISQDSFRGLSSLSRLPDQLAPLPELVNLGLWSASNPDTVPFGARNLTFAAIDVEAWPRQCVWTGPMLNNFSCAECTFGYIDVNGVCTFPSFGVRTGYWDPSTIENDPQMGVPDSNGDRVIFLRNQINLDPPATTLDPKRGFVGYSNNDYVGVSYELAFVGDISIGCGGADDVVTGDTSAQTPVFLGLSGTTNIPFDSLRALLWGFSDRPAYLQFEVTTAGNITFDSCDSLYTTSMMVFRGWGSSAVSNVSNLVGNDFMPDEMVDGWASVRFPFLNWSNREAPWQAGCPSSMLARRKIYLISGRYTLMIRGLAYGEDLGGTYAVKMHCADGATTRSVRANDPGGLFGNPKSGQISGTPESLGENYTMLLRAIDSVTRSTTTVASWRFSVRERIFSTASVWNNSPVYDSNRGILTRYHTNELHSLSAPSVDRADLFTSPANNNFEGIVFLFLVNGTDCDNASAAFVNVVTGAAVFTVTCEGNYTAILKARDDAGFETVVNEWTFEARILDTTDPAFGPNGRGCAHGTAVDDIPMDRSFACDCSGTAFVGQNCDVAVESSSDNANAIAGTLAAVVIVILVFLALLFSRYQLYRERQRPEDVSGLQDEVLEELGTSLVVNKNEIGVLLQFDGHPADNEKPQLTTAILESVREVPDLSRRLLSLVKGRDVCVRFSTQLPYALLVMPKPATLKNGTVEDLASTIAAFSVKKQFIVRVGTSSITVVDATVALAKNLPAELDRQRITRLNVLGEGHFGEVFKGIYAQKNSLRLTVAVKSLKMSDTLVRDSLLREAALMALCDHQNLVQLLGIVTVPRNMPPLLVIEFCEHGTVLDVIRDPEAADLDTHLRLSFCHDVASGLHYLGSRRIVHRDVAARNVLLDSVYACKVSDFGMSAAVSGNSDGDYASNYVKLTGELPIRWSAIEVLKENKYSRASDVWSFGIFVYEVMSLGAVPYEDFSNLADLTEKIKNGYQMACPDQCPLAVHEQVMVPCWNPDPSKRPGFSSLTQTLVSLGVVADEPSRSRPPEPPTSLKRNSSAVREGQNSLTEKEDLDNWRTCFTNRLYLGASVHHIGEVLLPKVLELVKPPWKNSRGKEVFPADSATIRDCVKAAVIPTTRDAQCPRDGDTGCAYVDTLNERDDVGKATALLSYTWSYKLTSVANALRRWARSSGLDAKRSYIWVCALCLNQHRIPARVTPEKLAAEFRPRVLTIGRILPMLEPWDAALYLTRAWCLFELYTAIGQQGRVKIEVILSAEQHEAYTNAMKTIGYRCIDHALGGIHSENATASQPADLEAIRKIIESTPGGFAQLNTTVQRHLARWFEAQGAIRTSVRMVGRTRTDSGSKSGSRSVEDDRTKSWSSSGQRLSLSVPQIKRSFSEQPENDFVSPRSVSTGMSTTFGASKKSPTDDSDPQIKDSQGTLHNSNRPTASRPQADASLGSTITTINLVFGDVQRDFTDVSDL